MRAPPVVDTAKGIAVVLRELLPRLIAPPPRPDSMNVRLRLAALPRVGLPLQRPVTIRWNQHHVPFIEAETDDDLAAAFGVVHVHLRWTQMELMRRVSQGRTAEMLGPLGIELDRALRTLDFCRAAPAIAASLPADTRRWIEAYCAGINHAVARAPMPPDFRPLGLGREPWTLTDLLTLGRLAAADATWPVWLALLPRQGDPSLSGLWQRLLSSEATPERPPSPAGLGGVLSSFTRQASNALAVAPSRSGSGGAWLAGDTHLPALLPNLWLLAGCRAPSLEAVGLMVPGIPVIAVGRTPHIAWGGTNLHAASSDLFDVTDLPPDQITQRHETLRVRGARDRTIVIRETAYGPVISDLRAVRSNGRTIALRWMGHRPSDEITALLGVARARDWQAFRDALDLLALPGQNMLFADRSGHIGKAMAVHLPVRRLAPPESLVFPRDAAAAWERRATGRDLPATYNPPEGFVASANDKPEATPVPVGWFFSSRRRIDRLNALLHASSSVSFDDIAAIQQDTTMAAAAPVRDRLVDTLRAMPSRRLSAALEQWDLRYDAGSAGALVFEVLLYHLGVALHGKRRLRAYSATWDARGLLFADIMQADERAIAAALRHAAPRAARSLRRFGTWGRMHRLDLRHFLASVPLLGRRYRFAEGPADGGSDTLLKTTNALTGRRHRSSLASTARHISDMSDPDANWFVLLGGQDGWLGSTTLLDQVALFHRGEYIRMPLRPDAVAAAFPLRIDLSP